MQPVICLVMVSLGLLLALPARGWDDALLERDLATATAAIAESETDLQQALRGYDQRTMTAIGSRLRDLKLRRDKIVLDIAAAKEKRSRAQLSALARQRPAILRQLNVIEPQVEAAAAAFKQDPAPQRAGRLRELSLQVLKLKDELAQVDQAVRADGEPLAAGTAPSVPAAPPGQAAVPPSPGVAAGPNSNAAGGQP